MFWHPFAPLSREYHHVVLLKGCREYFPRLTPIESAPKRSCFGADSYVSLSESLGGFVLVVPIDANHCQQAGGLQLDGTKAQLTPTLWLNSYIRWSLVLSDNKLRLILPLSFQDLGTIWEPVIFPV